MLSEGHESVQPIDKVAGINPSWIIYQAGDLATNYIRCHHAHPLDAVSKGTNHLRLNVRLAISQVETLNSALSARCKQSFVINLK